ncbi:hypothetical protein CCHR01_03014 [Colletotrichum chrysophilum]|uniref:Uncharacterized protein n=1 Tax=Colletotrichum chrysophilum TaxID=1836956 RepID=A0AAD9ATS2_9PEZI|nr:hypothetical protein CCHR01_03014 [Colletotrichum chrysophilum]
MLDRCQNLTNCNLTSKPQQHPDQSNDGIPGVAACQPSVRQNEKRSPPPTSRARDRRPVEVINHNRQRAGPPSFKPTPIRTISLLPPTFRLRKLVAFSQLACALAALVRVYLPNPSPFTQGLGNTTGDRRKKPIQPLAEEGFFCLSNTAHIIAQFPAEVCLFMESFNMRGRQHEESPQIRTALLKSHSRIDHSHVRNTVTPETKLRPVSHEQNLD